MQPKGCTNIIPSSFFFRITGIHPDRCRTARQGCQPCFFPTAAALNCASFAGSYVTSTDFLFPLPPPSPPPPQYHLATQRHSTIAGHRTQSLFYASSYSVLSCHFYSTQRTRGRCVCYGSDYSPTGGGLKFSDPPPHTHTHTLRT